MYKQLNNVLLVILILASIVSFILLLQSIIYKQYVISSWGFPMCIALLLDAIYYNTELASN
jgi:hypothetical protein